MPDSSSSSARSTPDVPHERTRLQILARHAPPDAPPEPTFDRLTRLAARTFEVPVAAVTFVGENRRWVASCVGLEEEEQDVAREAAPCARAIEAGEGVTVIEDLRADERFAEHTRPHDGPPLRFYAGAPLVTAGGHALGAFCVLGHAPRGFDADDRAHLRDYAQLAVEKIEQRRTEAARRASEERHRQLLEHLPVGVYRSTPDGRLLEANAAMAELLGYESVEALLQERVQDMYVNDEDRVQHHLQLSSEEAEPAEFPLRRADGEVVWVRDYPRAVAEEAGSEIDYFDGVLSDITERRRAHEALRASERQYRQLFERANVPVMIVRPGDERILEANAEACRTYGFERGELVGTRLTERTADVERGREEVRRTLDESGTRSFETVHHRKDGTPIHLLVSCSSIQYEGEEAILYFGQDVTARRHMEDENEAWRAFYENTLDDIPLEIVVLDAEGRFRYVNEAAVPDEEVRREMIGETDLDYARRRDRDEQTVRQRYEWLMSVVEEKEKKRYEETLTGPDGKQRHHRRVATPVLGDDGTVDYVIGYSIDLTDQKRAEEKLVEAKEEAEEMARLKSTFLTNMSHEIRTPLASILGFAEVLVEETEGKQREFAELIEQGGERLADTLDSVLDLARLEAGGFEPDLETVSAQDVMQDAADLYAPMAEEAGLAFEMENPEEELRFRADRAGVGRMVANLLSNAIKFTKKGHVRLAAERAGEGRVELRVSDTGVGMEKDFREHLFEAFRQESSGLAREHGGTGLGLSITRHLADVMDAEVRVKSQKGEGSTFVLSFPEQQDPSGPESARPASDEPLPDSEPGQGQLLAVEDNRDTRRLLKRVLRPTWAATTARGPQEALEAAEETAFDAVIVDIHLAAELDGTDVMHRLRRDGPRAAHYRQVPFVALTAYAMPDDEAQFLEDGFDAYLPKPFTKEDLLTALQKAKVEKAPSAS
jgi:PAS domain S-box-containing protein